MKKKTLFVLLLLVAAGTVRAKELNRNITLWLMSNNVAYQNSELSAMLGYKQDVTDGLAGETGIAGSWRMFAEGQTSDNTQSRFAAGPFLALHFPTLINVPNPIKTKWLGDTLIGQPFIGCSYIFDIDGKGTSINPMVGVRVFNFAAITYQYSAYQGVNAADVSKVGLSLQFKL